MVELKKSGVNMAVLVLVTLIAFIPLSISRDEGGDGFWIVVTIIEAMWFLVVLLMLRNSQGIAPLLKIAGYILLAFNLYLVIGEILNIGAWNIA